MRGRCTASFRFARFQEESGGRFPLLCSLCSLSELESYTRRVVVERRVETESIARNVQTAQAADGRRMMVGCREGQGQRSGSRMGADQDDRQAPEPAV